LVHLISGKDAISVRDNWQSVKEATEVDVTEHRSRRGGGGGGQATYWPTPLWFSKIKIEEKQEIYQNINNNSYKYFLTVKVVLNDLKFNTAFKLNVSL
jgi:hypothetical protein